MQGQDSHHPGQEHLWQMLGAAVTAAGGNGCYYDEGGTLVRYVTTLERLALQAGGCERCHKCGQVFRIDEMNFDTRDEEWLCDGCYQEIPRSALVAELLELHSPYAIYEPCEHQHTEPGGAVVEIDEIGLTCAKEYEICRACCTDANGQTEACISSHEHGPNLPICATVAILERGARSEPQGRTPEQRAAAEIGACEFLDGVGVCRHIALCPEGSRLLEDWRKQQAATDAGQESRYRRAVEAVRNEAEAIIQGADGRGSDDDPGETAAASRILATLNHALLAEEPTHDE